MSIKALLGSVLAVILSIATPVIAQQMQTSDLPPLTPLYRTNVRYLNGMSVGFAPTATGTNLFLSLSAGTSFFSATIQNYAGGTLTLVNGTNYVFLSTTTGIPASSTSNFTSGQFPVAIVVASGGLITSIVDVRTIFFSGGGSGGGFTAGGDLSGSSTSQTVIGLNGVPFCAGYTPLNGELVEYTTGGSPNPCYTAAILQQQFSTNYISVPSSANQVIGLVPNALGATVTVPASCTGSVAKAYASATASTVFTVVDLNTSTTLCTLTWAISGTVPTITGAGGTVSVGDIVEFIGPATADLTLGNITIGIHGTH